MGRAVIVEDGIESYGSALAAKKELIVGLIFGQEISAQKSCVIHMARTPEPIPEEEEQAQEESQNKKPDSEKKPVEDFDDDLVLDHARQVLRALPGGITILGLFIVHDVDPFQNTALVNRLRKILTSIDAVVKKNSIRQQMTCERIVLHIHNKSNKYTCKTLEIGNSVSSPKPADWKFVSAAGSPWLELQCTLCVEFFIALSDAESAGTLRQQLEAAIDLYATAVNKSICIIDGEIPRKSDLLDKAAQVEKGSGKKKSKPSNCEERIKQINVQILLPEPVLNYEKHECSSELKFGGQMCIKAYVHGKATAGEASQVLREDILRSLWARCDMHCDSLIGDEQRGKPDVKAVLHEPPRRVLAPLPYSPISVSDYLFPGEGPADSLTSLADLLDLGMLLEGDVQDYWEAAAELNDVSGLESEISKLETTITNQTLTAASSTNSRVILLSGFIALLAIILSYLTLQLFKSN
nr:EOG090X0BI6 [Scapholeberis mucronata]